MLGLGAARVQAQTGVGLLTGVVTDAQSGLPLQDVTVTATSPALPGSESTVTDASGTFRLSQLPVGTYTLRLEGPNRRPYVREGIELGAQKVLRVNAQLMPDVLGGEITVLGVPPTVDIGSSQTGLAIRGDVAERVPVAPSTSGGLRDVLDLALLAPQTQRDLFGVSIDGATSPENQYWIDGLSVNDTGYGAPGTRFPVEFAQELQVLTGGYLPEYGRTQGGVLSVVSRSGGNEFHGSVFMTYSPGALAQSGHQVQSNNTIFGSSTRLSAAGDVGFTLGGSLVKDRLWFFVGLDPSMQHDSLERTVSVFDVDAAGDRLVVPGGYQRTEVPSATRRYDQTARAYPFIAKLTWVADEDHRISISFSGMPYRNDVPFSRGVDGTYNALGVVNSGNVHDLILRSSSSFLTKALLLDLVMGWHHQHNANRPIDDSWIGSGLSNVPTVYWGDPQSFANFGALDPAYTPDVATICAGSHGATRCRVANYQTGGPDAVQEIGEDRLQTRVILTGLLQGWGHHVLKAGVDADVSAFDKTSLLTGGARYYASGMPDDAVFSSQQFGVMQGPDSPLASVTGAYRAGTKSVVVGGFLQDSWNVLDRVTLNLGVRYDAQSLHDPSGSAALTLGNQWAPRLGVVWDPTAQGRAKLFASYAWYYEQSPLRLADWAFSRRSFVAANWTNCRDPSAVWNGRCDQQQQARVLPGGAGPSASWAAYSSDEIVDPELLAPRTEEIVAGAEVAITPALRVSFTYLHRNLTHGMEDFSLDEGATYWVGNPGWGVGSSLVPMARIYNAYTVALTRTLEDRWLAQASYTYSTLDGNSSGYYTPEDTRADITQISPNATTAFDLPNLRVNRFGPLPADLRHQIKIFTAYQIPLSPTVSLSVGAVYGARSGAPISALGTDASYGPLTVFILPRGAMGRLPWVHQVDLHATADLSIGAGMTLSLGADCFNVIGSQQTVAVDQSYVFPAGSTAVLPIPGGTTADLPGKVLLAGSPPVSLPQENVNTNFGRGTAYQSPRSIRFLARLRF